MANIKDLLSGFNKQFSKDFAEKDVVISVFEKILNIKIERSDVLIKNEVLYIKTNPYIRTEVQLHKKEIIKEIQKQKIGKTIRDIK
ncbi:MAG: hypothetical protein R3B39_00585 [Candidatus Paceibacterota bacterium]